MATNQFFNFSPKQVTTEQLLVEDLLIETIKIHGTDCYYLPRESRDQIDRLMGEDQLKSFGRAYPIEMYLENTTGMEGAGDLISKFGLELKDEVTMLVSRRRFNFVMPSLERPREGDIVYVPLFENFFEITFVEHEDQQAMFHTLGRGRGGNVYVYALRLKQFVFSNEQIQTGVEEVDEQVEYPSMDLILIGGTGEFDATHQEIVYQGTDLDNATAFATVTTWDTNTNRLGVILVNGLFANTANVRGESSGAEWILSHLDDLTPMEKEYEDLHDNKQVETESNALLTFDENNPFGNP